MERDIEEQHVEVVELTDSEEDGNMRPQVDPDLPTRSSIMSDVDIPPTSDLLAVP